MTNPKYKPNEATLEKLRELAKKGGSKSCEDHTFSRIGPQACAIMQLLIHRAKEHKDKINYKKLGEEVYTQGLYQKTIGQRHLNGPLGIVGFTLLALSTEKRKIPPLTALVVGNQTQVPNIGIYNFMDFYFSSEKISYKKMSTIERRGYALIAQEYIYNYQHRWDKILHRFGFVEFEPPLFPRPLPLSGKSNSKKRKVESPKLLRSGYARGGGGPSPEHEAIVKYVAKHPWDIGLPKDLGEGCTKYRFLSGDRPDVFFESQGRVMAIEVKPDFASEDDLERGIYQCIKYRAVARAQQEAEEDPPTADVRLVVGKALPSNLQKLAKQLKVDWTEMPPEKCMSYKKMKDSKKG